MTGADLKTAQVLGEVVVWQRGKGSEGAVECRIVDVFGKPARCRVVDLDGKTIASSVGAAMVHAKPKATT